MANLRKLMRLAAEYEEHEGRNLRGFLGFAEERTLRDEREGMAAVQVEGHDGVRVMTVHAAKGLQFPVVAVADLGRGLGTGSRDGDVVIGRIEGTDGDPTGAAGGEALERARFGMRLPIAAAASIRLWELVELCEDERRADIEEACRLVYVAVSRAEDRLILSGIFRASDLEAPEEPKATHSALKLLLPALAPAGLGRRRGTGRAGAGAGDRRWPRRRTGAATCGADPGAQRGAGGRASPPDALAGAERRRRRRSRPGAPARAARARRRGRPPVLFGARNLLRLPLPLLRRTRDRAGGAHASSRNRLRTMAPRNARRPMSCPLPQRDRASGRWRSATLSTPPWRPARDAPGRRPAVRSWRRSWHARGWARTARRVHARRGAGRRLAFLRASRRARGERGAHPARGPVRARAGGRGGARKDRPARRSPRGALGRRLQDRRLARRRPGRARGALRDAARPLRAGHPRRAPKRRGAGRPRRVLLPRRPGPAPRSRPTTRPGSPRRASASSASSRGSAPATSSAPTTPTRRSATAAPRRRGSAGSPPGSRSGPAHRVGSSR